MVQLDALSPRPDLCPEDNDNEDIVMLPDELFVNLIDTNLQERIAMADDLDGNAAEALKFLLRLQTIKAIVNSRRFKGSSSVEPRRVQVLDLYCLTRFESEGSRRGDVY